MPRVIEAGETPALGLGNFIAAVAESGFDPADEEAFVGMAPLLAGLAQDRTFLGDIVVDALKEGAAGQEAANPYGPQVLMLHGGNGWFVRANIWPAANDAAMRGGGPASFFYGMAHDHNFNFLTVGYLGPGYWSDYYEYDYGAVAGHAGEDAALRFTERSRLNEGRLMLYRAHRDVHAQWSADSLSVSLNLMQASRGQGWRDQYRFDLERGTVAGLLSPQAADGLMALLPALGGAEGLDLLDRFAAGHPSERIRFGAIDALAGMDGPAVYEQAADVPGFVGGMARHRLAQWQAGAAWRDATGSGNGPQRNGSLPHG